MALCRLVEISGVEYSRFTLVIKLTTAGVDTAEKCSFKVLFGPDLSTGFAWLCMLLDETAGSDFRIADASPICFNFVDFIASITLTCPDLG